MTIDDPGKKSRLSEFTKEKQLEWKRKMLVFSFFLAISIVIWLLNALSKEYTTVLKYPVAYSKFPSEKVLVSEVPDHLGLKVTAYGYPLLSYKFSKRPIPLNFPVSSFAMNRMPGDTTKFYILTRYVRERLERQLSSELQLQEISPDTLMFQFANEVSRWVPLEPNLNFEIEKGFTVIDDVVISPESIMVTGPDIFLDTLHVLSTERRFLGKLDKNFRGNLKIANYPNLNYQKTAVNCAISIEKLTEVQVRVPVQVVGLPDSLRIQTFPQRLTVTGMIGLSKYERIVPEAFRLEVSYGDVLQNKSRLEVQMKIKPEELTSAEFYPKSVEYLLSVK
ncbi:MAG: hypothetical protein WD577_13480 [Bacteroidales bacterium]